MFLYGRGVCALGNSGALRFYKRNGFDDVAKLPDLVAEGFAETLLRKMLISRTVRTDRARSERAVPSQLVHTLCTGLHATMSHGKVHDGPVYPGRKTEKNVPAANRIPLDALNDNAFPPPPLVQRNKETAWHVIRGVCKMMPLQNGHPSNRKGELPMEFTAKLTVASVVLSFSFLAAVILGMI